MFEEYEPLCQLLLAAGEIRGRKKLQKMVYIAQVMGHPFAEAFHLHMYGPYSDELATRLREMQDWGFGVEAEEQGPGGGPVYTYRPGERAAALAARVPAGLGELARHLNTQETTLLEGAATVLYLEGQGLSRPEAAEMLPRVKPQRFPSPGKVAPVLAFLGGLEEFRAQNAE